MHVCLQVNMFVEVNAIQHLQKTVSHQSKLPLSRFKSTQPIKIHFQKVALPHHAPSREISCYTL